METRAFFTVWRFLSPSTGETATVAKHAEPNDKATQHEYQRVIWQGLAFTKLDALAQAGIK